MFCVRVCPLSRFWRQSGVGVVLTSLALGWSSRMVSDVFQPQKKGSWILEKKRAERVLASSISIDGRKEWTCKFCSESNVCTRWRCRRCYHDIPAGVRGKCRQAIAARTGECFTGFSTSSGRKTESSKVWRQKSSLRATLEAVERKRKEGEGAHGGQGIPSRRENGMKEE